MFTLTVICQHSNLRRFLHRRIRRFFSTLAGRNTARMHLTDELLELMMGYALAEARRAAEQDEVPIGAVVGYGGRLIAKGHNLTETLADPTAHAEMIAISAALNAIGGKYLHRCQLYVTVEPCAMCAGAIAWTRFDTLVYGAPEHKFGFSRLRPAVLHPSTKVIGNVKEEECAALMKTFFQSKRKR